MALALPSRSSTWVRSRPPTRPRTRLAPIIAQASSTSSPSTAEVIRDLKPGEYFRPPKEETSGFRGNDARFKRSPCPALNTLANHGYINRDGANITINMLVDAAEKVFNLDRKAARMGVTILKLVSNSLPGFSFHLSDLSFHNRGEHDASLFHDDLYFKKDPSEVNKEYAEQLLARSKDGKNISVSEIVEHRRERLADSKARNPEFYFDGLPKMFAHSEAALALNVLGHKQKLPVEHARSFFIEEKIPDDFVRPEVPIVGADISPTSAEITELMKND